MYAAIELATDGRHWAEREGSAMLFAAGGSQIGLVLLFPDLPESNTQGATTDWRITFPLKRDVIATEAARGRDPGLNAASANGSALDTASEPLLAKVRLEDWTQVSGVSAAVLTMKATYPVNAQILDSNWSHDIKLPDTRITGEMSLEGRYLVLQTGRLLRATVDMTGTTDMTWAQPGQPPQTMRQTRLMHMQAHLVGACDGPTEQPVKAQLSREDVAIDACGALAVAVGEGARAEALSILSPELRQAHGDEALWTTLATYVRSRGQRALPPPVFVEDSNVSSGTDVVIVVEGSTQDQSQSNTMTPVEVEFTMRGTTHGWLVRRIRARATLICLPKSRGEVVSTRTISACSVSTAAWGAKAPGDGNDNETTVTRKRSALSLVAKGRDPGHGVWLHIAHDRYSEDLQRCPAHSCPRGEFGGSSSVHGGRREQRPRGVFQVRSDGAWDPLGPRCLSWA